MKKITEKQKMVLQFQVVYYVIFKKMNKSTSINFFPQSDIRLRN